jgi:hypothetical protein
VGNIPRQWPSALDSAEVAKCYVCNAVVGKHHMIDIGSNKDEIDEPRTIWRCKTCTPGSKAWWDIFIPKYGHIEPFKSFALLYANIKPTNNSEMKRIKKFEEKARRKVKVAKEAVNVSGVREADKLRQAIRPRTKKAKASGGRSVSVRRVKVTRR